MKNFILIVLLFTSFFSFSQNIKKDTLNNTKILSEVIFKKNVYSTFKISPNGKYLVSVLETNVGYDIVVLDIDSHKLYKRFPIGKYSINNISFVSSRRLLIEVLGKIIAIDIDGSNTSILVDNISGRKYYHYASVYKYIRRNNVINTLPEDDEHILIESFNYKGFSTIKKVNIFTGEHKVLINGEKLKVDKWFLDYKGNVKIGFREKNNQMQFLKKSAENGKWKPLLINVDGVFYSVFIDGKSYLKQSIIFEGFAKEENIVYLAINIGTDKRKLVKYNILKDELIGTVIENSIYDVSDPMLEKENLIYHKGELIGYNLEGAYPKVKWFSAEMQNYQTIIDSENPSFINEVISISENKEKLLIKKWNDTYRGEIIVFDTKDKTFTTMLALNDELSAFKLSKSKVISYKTEDDFKIQGYLNYPKVKNSSNKYPLVVIPHGGPFSRDTWGYDPIVHFFNNNGFATLKVNFRGSVGYGKGHLLQGISRINTVMIKDIHDGVKYLQENKKIDSRNIFIFGHSYGGYASYMNLINFPDTYNAAVAVSAPTDLKQLLKDYKKSKKYFSYEFWEYALGGSDKNKLKEISPIYHAMKIKKPIFIFHGEKDKTISVEQSKKMNELLKKYGKESFIRVLSKEGHSLYNSNNIIYILNKTLDFFNKNKIE